MNSNPSDNAASVTGDLPCVQCGYNLRTLSWDGRCPECNAIVRESAPPAGFTFRSQRDALNARLGLILLAASVLVGTAADILVRIAALYCMQMPRFAFRGAFRLWVIGVALGHLLELTAFWFLIWKFASSSSPTSRWFQRGLVLVLLAALLMHSVDHARWALLDHSIASNKWQTGLDAMLSLLWLSRPMAWLVACHRLLWYVQRGDQKGLRILGYLAILASCWMLLLSLWNMLVWLDAALSYSPWQPQAEVSTWSRILSVLQAAKDFLDGLHILPGQAATTIVIMLFVWLYLRKLPSRAAPQSPQ
jgi:hypothetical protein